MINYREGYRQIDQAPAQNPDKSGIFRTLLETFVPVVEGKRIPDFEGLFDSLNAYRTAHKKTDGKRISDEEKQKMIEQDLKAGGILDSNDPQRASVQIEALRAGFHADENHWNKLLDNRENHPSIFMRPSNKTW